MDLTLDAPGATLVVELFGFQIEAGPKVTSPIAGDAVPEHRAADELSLLIPAGLADILIRFSDGTAQSFLGIVGPFEVDPSVLTNSLLSSIGTLTSATWASMAFPWSAADFPWGSNAAATRARTLAGWFNDRPMFVAVKNSSGQVIGYRRARVVRQALPQTGGAFVHAGARYQASDAGLNVVIDAMTDAGNGLGQTGKSVSLIVGATLAPGIKAGVFWVPPGGLVGGVSISPKSIDLPLRATVRERLKFLLRF
jgi:hypothetical protein